MIDKKYIKLTIGVLLVIITILSFITVKNNKISRDERYFRIEYEKYNNKKTLDGNSYLKIDIIDKNGMDYVNSQKVIEIIKKGTGIIYFGFPQSSFCRNSTPVLIEAANEKGIEKIYYYNAYADRDEKYMQEDGSILDFKKGTDDYYKILELLGDKAEVYEGLNDDSIKRLYFPTVLFVKDGKIVKMHSSTVNSNKENKKLTKKEYKELKNIYIDGINKIKSSCNGDNSC